MADSTNGVSTCASKPSAPVAASRELLTVGGESLPFLERLLKQPSGTNQRSARKQQQEEPCRVSGKRGQAPPAMFTAPVAESSVLARLRGFLPQMEQANQQLQREMEEQGQEAVSMEAVDDSQEHIEMDLSLGLVDLRTADAVAAAERALAGQGGDVGRGVGSDEAEEGGESSESDSELESESEDGECGLGGEGGCEPMEEGVKSGIAFGDLLDGASLSDGAGSCGGFQIGLGGVTREGGSNMHPGQHKGGYGRRKKGVGKAKKGVKSRRTNKVKAKIVEL